MDRLLFVTRTCPMCIRNAVGVCHRRNYTAIFDTALMRGEGVLLTLIGHGDLQIPAVLNTMVAKRAGLNCMARLKNVVISAIAVLCCASYRPGIISCEPLPDRWHVLT